MYERALGAAAMKIAIWVLWPSFLVGAAANALCFAVFDPAQFHAHWELLPETRIGTYTVGFFAFWAISASSSALTCFLQRSAHELNRRTCPLSNGRRPADCRSD
jgi:hypothetical protein